MGSCVAESRVFFLPNSTLVAQLWESVEHILLPCRVQLMCWAHGWENVEHKVKRGSELMFPLTAEGLHAHRICQACTESKGDRNTSDVCFVCLDCKFFGPRTVSHHVFTQILAQQVTGLGRGLQSQVIIMNWLSSKCYLPKQYCIPLWSIVFINIFFSV